MTTRTPKVKKGAKTPIEQIYEDDHLLFYLRTHPHWYKIIARYPQKVKDFTQVAKEELKITTYHKLERFKNQMSLFGMLSEYMKHSQ